MDQDTNEDKESQQGTPIFSVSENNLLTFSDEEKQAFDEHGVTYAESTEDLPAEPKPGDTAMVRLAIFRTGQFEHPWYGDLDFDRAYLEQIINNYERGVVAEDIGFNLNHNPSKAFASDDVGNVAWFKNLGIKKDEEVEMSSGRTRESDLLVADAELNSEGIKLVKDRRFAYSSAEIDNDYTTHEKQPIANESEGEEGDDKAVITHGPTLTGCAFTNNPFIPALGSAVEFSENPTRADVEEQKERVKMSESECGIRFCGVETQSSTMESDDESTHSYSKDGQPSSDPDVTTDSDNEPSTSDSNESEDDTKTNQSDDTKENHMDLTKLFSKVDEIEDLEEQIDYIESSMSEFDGESKVAAETLLSSKRDALESKRAAQKNAERAEQRKQAYEEATEKLSETRADLEEARAEKYSARVKNFCSELREDGHHESVVKEVKRQFSAIGSQAKDMTFDANFADAEDGEQEIDLFEFTDAIFSKLPESARLKEDEKLTTDEEEAEDVKQTDPEQEQQDFDEPEEDDVDEASRQRKLDAYKRNYGADATPPGQDVDLDEFQFIDPDTGEFDFSSFFEAKDALENDDEE